MGTSAFLHSGEKDSAEDTLWHACLVRLERDIPRPMFEVCLRGSRARQIAPQHLQVTLAHGYAFDMLRSRQRASVMDAACRVLGEIGGGEWAVEWAAPPREEEAACTETATAPPPPTAASRARESRPSVPRGRTTTPSQSPGAPHDCADAPRVARNVSAHATGEDPPRYTFERLVTGPSNQLAVDAARRAATDPGGSFSPLVIYGDCGLGKTHLMYAVKQMLARTRPKVKAVYTTSETFTNELVDALQERRLPAFRKKYRHVDVLMIDDVEFLIGKERIQEEFYHTFEEIAAGGRQVILTCDRPPRLLTHFQDRLSSRLSSGLSADIQAPTEDMRKRILSQRVKESDVAVTDDVLEYIAANFCGSVRNLEGALVRVLAYASGTSEQVISLSLAQRALQGLGGPRASRPRRVELCDILQKVSEYYHVEPNDLLGSRRDRQFSTPRHMAMYLASEVVRMRCREIGEAFGNRDYSTVKHAIDKVTLQREAPRVKSDLKHLKDMLGVEA